MMGAAPSKSTSNFSSPVVATVVLHRISAKGIRFIDFITAMLRRRTVSFENASGTRLEFHTMLIWGI